MSAKGLLLVEADRPNALPPAGDGQPEAGAFRSHGGLALSQPAVVQGILHIARGVVSPLRGGLVAASGGLHHHQDGVPRLHRVVGAKAPSS